MEVVGELLELFDGVCGAISGALWKATLRTLHVVGVWPWTKWTGWTAVSGDLMHLMRDFDDGAGGGILVKVYKREI